MTIDHKTLNRITLFYSFLLDRRKSNPFYTPRELFSSNSIYRTRNYDFHYNLFLVFHSFYNIYDKNYFI